MKLSDRRAAPGNSPYFDFPAFSLLVALTLVLNWLFFYIESSKQRQADRDKRAASGNPPYFNSSALSILVSLILVLSSVLTL